MPLLSRNRRKYEAIRKTIDGLEPLIAELKSAGEDDLSEELKEIKDQLIRMLLHSTGASGTHPIPPRDER